MKAATGETERENSNFPSRRGLLCPQLKARQACRRGVGWSRVFRRKNQKYAVRHISQLRFAGSVGASSEAMSHRDREQPER